MTKVLIKNVSIIDGTGEKPLEKAALLIQDKRIEDIFQDNSYKPLEQRQDIMMIDGKGGTLLPGLIDAHMHAATTSTELMELQRKNFPSMLAIKMIENLQDTLEQGFTTVRDAGGADPGFREAIEQKLIVGPRMFVSGGVLSQTGGHGDLRYPTEVNEPQRYAIGFVQIVCDGVDSVRKETREQIRKGVDQIKICASGGAATPEDLETSQFSLEELEAIVFEAEAANKYVAAHCYSNKGARLCLKAGVRSIEHGNLLDRESMKLIADKGAFLVPTLNVFVQLCKNEDKLNLPDYFKEKARLLKERAEEALSCAHEEGVKIASGSDAIGEFQNTKGLELELKAKVIGAMNAIVSATKTNAELLRMEKEIGTIEKGKFADIIILKGNPLKQIEIIQKYKENITLIMKGGEIFKNII